MKTKVLSVKDRRSEQLKDYPNFAANGSIKGMKKLYYGKDALLIKCGSYVYNVSGNPGLYNSI